MSCNKGAGAPQRVGQVMHKLNPENKSLSYNNNNGFKQESSMFDKT